MTGTLLRSRTARIGGLAVVVAAVLAVSFVIGRSASGPPASASDPGPPARTAVGGGAPPESPIPLESRTPAAGETPDTSKLNWFVPFMNAEAAKPRFDQVINGIPVGPNVGASGIGAGRCTPGSARDVAGAKAEGTDVFVRPTWLPARAELVKTAAIECDGGTFDYTVDYAIRAAPDFREKVSAGVPWKQAGPSGAVTIERTLASGPGFSSNIAAENWSAGTIAGRPAALGAPAIAIGFGTSAIVIWDNGVQTVLAGEWLTLDELVQIAEGLYR